MKTWIAIVFSLGLMGLCYAAAYRFHVNVMWIIILATAAWAAVDSSKLGLKRYKSGISHGPVTIFIMCLLIWIVAFPWYLSVRHKIKNGTAVLKEEEMLISDH